MHFTILRQFFGISALVPVAVACAGLFAVACGDDQVATGNESAADSSAGDTIALQDAAAPDLAVVTADLNVAPPDLGVGVDVAAAA